MSMNYKVVIFLQAHPSAFYQNKGGVPALLLFQLRILASRIRMFLLSAEFNTRRHVSSHGLYSLLFNYYCHYYYYYYYIGQLTHLATGSSIRAGETTHTRHTLLEETGRHTVLHSGPWHRHTISQSQGLTDNQCPLGMKGIICTWSSIDW